MSEAPSAGPDTRLAAHGRQSCSGYASSASPAFCSPSLHKQATCSQQCARSRRARHREIAPSPETELVQGNFSSTPGGSRAAGASLCLPKRPRDRAPSDRHRHAAGGGRGAGQRDAGRRVCAGSHVQAGVREFGRQRRGPANRGWECIALAGAHRLVVTLGALQYLV